MAKLRSISKQIPWFLAAKAIALGAAWWFLPLWLFALAALYVYFVPLFTGRGLPIPFFLLLALVFLLPHTVFALLVVSGALFLILGIKELILVRRAEAYHIVTLLLCALTILNFFERVQNWQHPLAFISALIVSGIFFILAVGHHAFLRPSRATHHDRYAVFLAALLLWHITIVTMIVPLGGLTQAAIVFLAAATLLEFLADRTRATLSYRRGGSLFSALAILTLIILLISVWSPTGT